MHDNTTMSTPFGLHDAPFFDSGHDCGGMIRSCLFAAGSGFLLACAASSPLGGGDLFPILELRFRILASAVSACRPDYADAPGFGRLEDGDTKLSRLRHHCLCELLWPHPWPWPLCMGAELYWLTDTACLFDLAIGDATCWKLPASPWCLDDSTKNY
jgi:hypothetical protein